MNDKAKWISALMVASLLAAPTGWTKDAAKESGDQVESAADASRKQAREANTEAAREAAEALEAATRLDLDIQLIGPTSVKIAGKR